MPTLGEFIGLVLDLVRNNKHSYEIAIKTCSDTLSDLWTTYNVYPTYTRDIKRQVRQEVENFRNIQKTSSNKRNAKWESKFEDFVSKSPKLFDIFCKDPNRRKPLEDKHGVPMGDDEWKYLESMRLTENFGVKVLMLIGIDRKTN